MGHIYFSGDDVDSGPSTSTAPAAGSTLFAHCCSRARVSYDEANPCYVFKAIRSPDSCSAAAALSSNSIKLFGCSVAGLSHAGDIAAHQGTISDIQFPFVTAPQALYSCSRDGYVKGWDLRSGQQAESYRVQQELYSFSVLDNLVAAGGQGDVLFWDRRTQKPLAAFDDMHMDDVTQVLFHGGSRKLITASQDGLVAVHDLSAGLQQDEGFIAALNVGTSVEQLGLYGSEEQHLWCRTGTETLQLWDWLAATVEDVAGGDTAVADLTDARQLAAAAASQSAAAALFSEVDYLIGCHYDHASTQLLLVAGTNTGTVGFFPVAEQQHRAGQLPPGLNILQQPTVVLSGCHQDVTFKTGSTTLSTIFRTISAHYGVVPVSYQLVQFRAQHLGTGKEAMGIVDFDINMDVLKKLFKGVYTLVNTLGVVAVAIESHLPYQEEVAALFRTPPLLFTVQRDTLDNRWAYAKRQSSDFLYHYIRGNASTVEAAAAKYDFIFVTERMDEALVVFMLEYGLTFLDIAYKYNNVKSKLYKPAEEMPKELNQYIIDNNQKDLQLWQIANRRLDGKVALMKQRCGATVFAAYLATFKQIQSSVQAQCANPGSWAENYGIAKLNKVNTLDTTNRCVQYVAR
eukprot:gene1783-2117_t